jgi:hypothetical protein
LREADTEGRTVAHSLRCGDSVGTTLAQPMQRFSDPYVHLIVAAFHVNGYELPYVLGFHQVLYLLQVNLPTQGSNLSPLVVFVRHFPILYSRRLVLIIAKPGRLAIPYTTP